MSELETFDLDRATGRAWSRFQARLADFIADMSCGDVLLIETLVADEDVAGATPYVQFAALGHPMVRGEVSSNAYLAEPYELDREQGERLVAMGWREPTMGAPDEEPAGPEDSANFFVTASLRDADRLAVMSVKALREVFGVAHPAFLSLADELAESGPEEPALRTATVEEPVATTPCSEAELRELVDRALEPLFGATPHKDDDGDIPVPWGSSLVFVRVEDDVPVVQLFSIVVEGVKDAERALFEVNVLNRDLRFLKFALVGDRILAHMHLPAWPFVPEHLRSMLTGMSQRLDELDEDLITRVGGRRAFEPDDARGTASALAVSAAAGEQDLDESLLTLLQLDAEQPGRVDPALAATVCHEDQSHIVALVRQSEEQESAWRESRDDNILAGDPETAAVCGAEMAAWERITTLLRRALRVVADQAQRSGGARPASYPMTGDDPA